MQAEIKKLRKELNDTFKVDLMPDETKLPEKDLLETLKTKLKALKERRPTDKVIVLTDKLKSIPVFKWADRTRGKWISFYTQLTSFFNTEEDAGDEKKWSQLCERLDDDALKMARAVETGSPADFKSRVENFRISLGRECTDARKADSLLEQVKQEPGESIDSVSARFLPAWMEACTAKPTLKADQVDIFLNKLQDNYQTRADELLRKCEPGTTLTYWEVLRALQRFEVENGIRIKTKQDTSAKILVVNHRRQHYRQQFKGRSNHGGQERSRNDHASHDKERDGRYSNNKTGHSNYDKDRRNADRAGSRHHPYSDRDKRYGENKHTGRDRKRDICRRCGYDNHATADCRRPLKWLKCENCNSSGSHNTRACYNGRRPETNTKHHNKPDNQKPPKLLLNREKEKEKPTEPHVEFKFSDESRNDESDDDRRKRSRADSDAELDDYDSPIFMMKADKADTDLLQIPVKINTPDGYQNSALLVDTCGGANIVGEQTLRTALGNPPINSHKGSISGIGGAGNVLGSIQLTILLTDHNNPSKTATFPMKCMVVSDFEGVLMGAREYKNFCPLSKLEDDIGKCWIKFGKLGVTVKPIDRNTDDVNVFVAKRRKAATRPSLPPQGALKPQRAELKTKDPLRMESKKLLQEVVKQVETFWNKPIKRMYLVTNKEKADTIIKLEEASPVLIPLSPKQPFFRDICDRAITMPQIVPTEAIKTYENLDDKKTWLILVVGTRQHATEWRATMLHLWETRDVKAGTPQELSSLRVQPSPNEEGRLKAETVLATIMSFARSDKKEPWVASKKPDELEHTGSADLDDSTQYIPSPEDLKHPQHITINPKSLKGEFNHAGAKEALLTMLKKHQNVLLPVTGGNMVGHEHTIELTTDKPVVARNQRIPEAKQDFAEETMGTLKGEKMVRGSKSAFRASTAIADKKDLQGLKTDHRFCINYRALNKVTVRDTYPLPNIQEIVRKTARAAFITKIDLKSAFWQMKIRESDKHKTAFSINGRLYEWNVMPFGLVNAPASFQRAFDIILGDTADAYLDDVYVTTTASEVEARQLKELEPAEAWEKLFKQHLAQVESVLQRLDNAGLRIKLEKCEWFTTTLTVLGFRVKTSLDHNGSIAMDPAKTEVITNYKPPTNINEIQRFLGMANFYRQFIRRYSQIASPINDLLQGDKPWDWTKEARDAFEKLKNAITSAPVLRAPLPNLLFQLETDASDIALGAVLVQQTDKGIQHTILFLSKKLSQAEKKYCVREKEALAIVWGIEQCKYYLTGRKFVVITDHGNLQWLLDSETLSPRLARWVIKLQGYDFTIVYRQGKDNVKADCLSRMAEEGAQDTKSVLMFHLEEEDDSDTDHDSSDMPSLDSSSDSDDSEEEGAQTEALMFHLESSGHDDTDLPALVSDSDSSDNEEVHTTSDNKETTPDTGALGTSHHTIRLVINFRPLDKYLDDATETGYQTDDSDGDDKECYLMYEDEEENQELMPALREDSDEDDEDFKQERAKLRQGVRELKEELKSTEEPKSAQSQRGIQVKVNEDRISLVSEDTKLADLGDLDTWNRHLTQDPEYGEFWKYLKTNGESKGIQKKQLERFEYMKSIYGLNADGLLVWCNPKQPSQSKKILVPHALRRTVMNHHHDFPASAHFGRNRTKLLIRKHFYWNGMDKDISAFVRTCSLCRQGKMSAKPMSKHGLLVANDLYLEPFKAIYIDFIESLPMTEGGAKHILSVWEPMSNWIELIPVPDLTAVTVAKALWKHIITRHGAPYIIISDNGPAFRSELMEELCKLMKIRHRFSSAYHPQSNLVERAHRSLKASLKIFVQKQQENINWDDMLPGFTMAHNGAMCPTTGYTPAQIVYGRDIRIPLQSSLISKEERTLMDADDYFRRITSSHLEIATKLYKARIIARMAQAKHYDNHQISVSFTEGDVVLLWDPSILKTAPSAKLSMPWQGPWVITKSLGLENYRIRSQDKTRNVHSQRLARYYPEALLMSAREEEEWYKMEQDRDKEWKSTPPASRSPALKNEAKETPPMEVKERKAEMEQSDGQAYMHPPVKPKVKEQPTKESKSEPSKDTDPWRAQAAEPTPRKRKREAPNYNVGDMVLLRMKEAAKNQSSYWLGEVLEKDPVRVHIYRSHQPANKGGERTFLKSWWCPRTQKDAYTNTPKQGYEPWDVVIDESRIITAGFQLNGRGKIPTAILETLEKEEDLSFA